MARRSAIAAAALVATVSLALATFGQPGNPPTAAGARALVSAGAPTCGPGVAPPECVAQGGTPVLTQEGARFLRLSQFCYGDPARAGVNFIWLPITSPGGQQQWVDLSLFSSFAPGTFLAAGPLPPADRSYSWQGLLEGRAHYWRVNTLINGVWMPSRVSSFTTVNCPGSPASGLRVSLSCSPTILGTNRVSFEWNPAPGNSVQWLDLSLVGGFAPGTFLGAGPLPPDQRLLVWDGIRSNALHYWRVNAFVGGEWAGATATLLSAPC